MYTVNRVKSKLPDPLAAPLPVTAQRPCPRVR